MPIPVNNIFEVRCIYRVNLQLCMNVLHYNVSGDSSGTNESAWTDAFMDEYGGVGNGTFPFEFATVLSSDTVYVETVGQFVFPQRFAAQARAVLVAGTRAGNCRAQNIAWSTTKTGTLAGRNRVGRIQIGGLPVEDYSGGLIANAFKTTVAEDLVDYLASDKTVTLLPTLTAVPVIANKTLVPGSNPPKYVYSGSSEITTWTIRDQLRTARTRTIGVGI